MEKSRERIHRAGRTALTLFYPPPEGGSRGPWVLSHQAVRLLLPFVSTVHHGAIGGTHWCEVCTLLAHAPLLETDLREVSLFLIWPPRAPLFIPNQRLLSFTSRAWKTYFCPRPPASYIPHPQTPQPLTSHIPLGAMIQLSHYPDEAQSLWGNCSVPTGP